MIWEVPKYAELKMDAEIGSYQDDFDAERELPAFARIPRGLLQDEG